MAKTIKEMALEAYPCTFTATENGSKREGFELGANAVLEEIDKLISLWPEHPMKRTIKNKIKELEGK